ncbi:hypothetical protein [uncultured Alsobacter sp.]|uniref:hypothetical protein n=1 Tax=uncultured Alsobacter sp. TaxID=1748258 RepID=UPI0025D90685|nr:hypothetical protein [uncultured Alsobacter sp.]
MPKFSVTLSERVSYEIAVEAADEDAASRAAEDLFVQSGAPFRDFANSSVEREAADYVVRLPDDAPVCTVNPNGDVPDVLKDAALAVIAAFPEIRSGDPLEGLDAITRLGEVLPALLEALKASGVTVPYPAPDEDERAECAERGVLFDDAGAAAGEWPWYVIDPEMDALERAWHPADSEVTATGHDPRAVQRGDEWRIYFETATEALNEVEG